MGRLLCVIPVPSVVSGNSVRTLGGLLIFLVAMAFSADTTGSTRFRFPPSTSMNSPEAQELRGLPTSLTHWEHLRISKLGHRSRYQSWKMVLLSLGRMLQLKAFNP